MKHKIIKVNSLSVDEVALNLARYDDGDDGVEISLWAYDALNDCHIFDCESIPFPSLELAMRFIADFSQESANEYVKIFLDKQGLSKPETAQESEAEKGD